MPPPTPRNAPPGLDEPTRPGRPVTPGRPPITPGRHLSSRADRGVESNSRLTAATAAVLLVLLAVEGATIVKLHSLLPVHVFVGMLLIPPVLLKMGSTTYRFARYYMGSPAYRRKGPPPPLLRLLGPVVVASTVVLFASGVALMFLPLSTRGAMLFVHRASFVIWFIVMTVHVLGHALETASLAPRDWMARTRSHVSGAGARQWAVAISVAAGIPLGLLLLSRATTWFASYKPVLH
jgi:hypothetical protein